MSNDNEEKLFIKFQGIKYDLTDFKHKHPGGINTLKGIQNGDEIFNRFSMAPPHSKAALYLLHEYKVTDNLRDPHENNRLVANFKVNGIESTNGVGTNGIAKPKEANNNSNRDTLTYEIDESMEHLVDWSKAMLPQIGKLGKNYEEWVNKPVDRHLRLFGPDYLEMCTKTPWWVIPVFWIPVLLYSFHLGVQHVHNDGLGYYTITARFTAGIVFWTILEYTLHRWVFHLNTSNAGTVMCTFHFLMHGLHHKVPFDPYRLVFPPVPAVIITSIIYTPVSLLVAYPVLILCGTLTGYLVYDMTHFYLHYGSPSGGHFYHMKRYHYQHHFAHHDQGFGISSAIWDDIFDTRIILRKLKYVLKW